MTQRVARPMKFAAFISIIVSVAVIFAACQGAVGPAGDDGAPGATGAQGPQGPQGEPGLSALIATGGTQVIRVNDKVVVDGQTSTVEAADDAEDVPADFDVSGHFHGGTGDLTFKSDGSVTIDANGTISANENSFYTVEVSEAGMASLAIRENQTFPQNDGDNLVTFVVTATDQNGLEAHKTVVVQRNVAPVNQTPTIQIADGVGIQDAANEDDMTNELRPRLNQYVFSVLVADTGGTHFTDAESSMLTVEAESDDPAAASVAIDKQNIVITGHTAKAGVTITMRVVDAGGLESTSIDFTVNTVAGPAATGTIGPQNYPRGDTATTLVASIRDFFTPSTLTDDDISAESSDATKVFIDATAVVTGNSLMGIPRNTGSSTITVKATDAIGQYATQSFTATVRSPGS